MQTHKIQSNNTSFGYNPVVNAKLIHDLENAKKNKSFCEAVKNLCHITNQTELNLRYAEKKRMPKLQDKLANLFLPVKAILTDIIDDMFPSYNYKVKEYETYSEEMNARNLQDKKNHWLTVLCTQFKQDLDEKAAQEQQEFAEGEASGEVEGLEGDDSDLITSLMQHLMPVLPGTGSTSLTIIQTARAPKEATETDATENVEEAENTENSGEEISEELAEKIELGKSKVVEYIPEGNALKGFESLGGMKELKAELSDKVVDYLKNPAQAKQDAEDYGTKLPKGLLLYGPPGCGKTTVLERLSVEAGVPLLKLETGSLKGSYIHESSINTDAAFEYAYSIAKPDKPVIMMIDDGDSFFIARNDHTHSWEAEEMTSFLNKIQEAPTKNVMVALTTNKYDIMDTAIKRRFDTQVYVGLPDEEARKSLIKLFFSRNKMSKSLSENEEAVARMAKTTEGFPISAIQDMVYDACDIPKKEAKEARKEGKIIRREVMEQDFESVLNKTENQNKKIKEDLYKTNATRQSIGFNKK